VQLPPSFTVKEFKNIEGFLDKLPDSSYEYAIEFRHPSWGTEGPWEMLKHYNIAAVITDSPKKRISNSCQISLLLLTIRLSDFMEEIRRATIGITICILRRN
jgi:uncharacterized protein YecE (DUF72 family)